MLRRWKPVESIDALGGDGVIAGELSGDPEVPDGLLTVNGVPTSREIEVRDRKTRRVVAVHRSNTDGTYRFPGLNPALQYDVIARDFAGDYEDVIAGAVRPHTPDLLVPVAAGGKMAAFSDAYSGDVVSLLNFDGVDGAVTFPDQAGKVWSAKGGAQIDTARSKFGGAAGLFDGSSAYLSGPHSADFDIQGGDFTLEAWVYRNLSGSSHYLFSKRPNSSEQSGWEWRINASNTLQFFHTGGASLISSASVPSGEWVHLATARSGSTIRHFINGVEAGSGGISNGTQYPGGVFLAVASDLSAYFNGSIDEFRLTKGVARYTAAFTPPSAPFDL